MGRGLSDLQKTILRLALANWEEAMADPKRAGDPTPIVVDRDEILAAHFGWTHARARFRWKGRWWTYKDGRPGDKYAPAEIDWSRYCAAQTSVSRAIKRLLARRLLGGWGRYLTREGWTWARNLSVESFHDCQATQPLDQEPLSVESLTHGIQIQPLGSEELEGYLAERRRALWGPSRVSAEVIAKREAQHTKENERQREYARRRRARMKAWDAARSGPSPQF